MNTTRMDRERRTTLTQEAHLDSSDIVYEHPLNERVRTLLRLETLCEQGRFGLGGDTIWHSRLAIETLVDVLALLGRGDVRSDIQKELERVTGMLDSLRAKAGVDPSLLGQVLEECQTLLERLRRAPPGIPAELRDNEFLSTIAQRAGMLGGTCGFDLPGYHLWLHDRAENRNADLQRWFGAFADLEAASNLILRLLRDSSDPTAEIATNGMFQSTLDRATPYQLLRVRLPEDTHCFPEISGNRHFCTIRFMEQPELRERAQQSEADVEFLLERCVV